MKVLLGVPLLISAACGTGRSESEVPAYIRDAGFWIPQLANSWSMYEQETRVLRVGLLMTKTEYEGFLSRNGLDGIEKQSAEAAPSSFFKEPVLYAGMGWPEHPPKQGWFVFAKSEAKRWSMMILVDTDPNYPRSENGQRMRIYLLSLPGGR